MDTVKQLDKTKLKNIFLIHGEDASLQAFSDALEGEGYKVTIPEKGIKYELN
jgi:metallo-beta-lactamase family protein